MIVKKCIVVDDEPIARDIVIGYINQVPYLNLVGSCADAFEALEMIKEKKIDIIFLDINMPLLSGFNMIRTLQNKPDIIVTTAYSEYAVEGFELSVTDYLLKPFSFERFVQAVEKTIKRNSDSQLTETIAPDDIINYIFVKAEKKTFRLDIRKITYIESIGNYITIHTKRNQITSKQTLKQFLELLPREKFIRIHKSFIVSFKSIQYIEGNRAFVENKSIPIGKVFKESLLKAFRCASSDKSELL